MRLKYDDKVLEIISNTEAEADYLRKLGLKPYSPRCAGMLPDDNMMLVVGRQEANELFAGVFAEMLAADVKTRGAEAEIMQCLLRCMEDHVQ